MKTLPATLLGVCTLLVGSRVNAQALPAGGPAIVPKLSLRIPPHDDSLWQITFVRDLAVDARGNIYVYENTDHTVRVFDAYGTPVRRFGGTGGGPGEFTQAGKIAIMRDSLWVTEWGTNRVTAFSLAGRGARSFRISNTSGGDEVGIAAIAADGFVVTLTPAKRAATASTAFPASSFARGPSFMHTDNVGKPIHRLFGEQPVPRGLIVLGRQVGAPKTAPPIRGHYGQPFVDAPGINTTSDGKHVIRIATSQRNSGASGTLTVTQVGLRGDTTFHRTLRYTPRPVTPAEVNQLMDSLTRPRDIKPGLTFAMDRRMLEDSLIRATHWPPFVHAIAGTDGTIWLKQGGPNTGNARCWRLSPTGVYEATVQIPTGLSVVRASRAYIWGWRMDSDGLTIIERYAL
jgi:hypothetical protein